MYIQFTRLLKIDLLDLESEFNSKTYFYWCQGEPGLSGLAGLPGLPGEDGAPGQKVGLFLSPAHLLPFMHSCCSLCADIQT